MKILRLTSIGAFLATVLSVPAAPVVSSITPALTDRVGDHVAFVVSATGSGTLSYQWASNGTPITGQTSSSLVLTNIQVGNAGSYSVTVNDSSGTPTIANTALTVSTNYLPLLPGNLVVARVGDGVQALGTTTSVTKGNTLYLDQYTTSGTYVSSIQIPDETTPSLYPKGSTNSVVGSPALLIDGGPPDAMQEAYLTISYNQLYLCFAGYCNNYPYTGPQKVAGTGGVNYVRGLGEVNKFGFYSLAYTNYGLYSGGNALIHGMTTLDGTNFWVTGEAGANGVKFANSTVSSYATGSGIPVISSSGAGSQVVQILNLNGGSNLVFSDIAASPHGLYSCSGTPEPAASGTGSSANAVAEPGLPCDFAMSPDGLTLYIADAGPFNSAAVGGGGIERFDTTTPGSGYTWSYTLPVLPSPATNGAQGLVVYFPTSITGWGAGVQGAVLYATTISLTTNSLIEMVDNGSTSTPTILVTAGPNEALHGVRFSPINALPVGIAIQPASQTNFPNNTATFTVTANGSGPFFYQWESNGVNIAGATSSSLAINNLTMADAASYSVVISNEVPSTVTSSPAVLTIAAGPPSITSPAQSRTETVGDHLALSVGVAGSTPLSYQWYQGGTAVPGATTNYLSFVNAQVNNSGTYTMIVSNIFGKATNSATITITTSKQPLYASNVVVSRIGDGVETLSYTTGNTVYLDQYTPSGAYVNTIQIPDQTPGALILSGAAADSIYEGFLNRSGNSNYINIAGFDVSYPYNGGVGAAGVTVRSLAAIDATGTFLVTYTNVGLYSGGTVIRSVFSTDGIVSNWTCGQASSGGGVKFVEGGPNGSSYNTGSGIPAIAGTGPSTQVVSIDPQTNIVFSDDGTGATFGLDTLTGLANLAASPSTEIVNPPATSLPEDFAISPDYNTIYLADDSGTTNAGIQRWDMVNGTWTESYVLAVPGLGASGLAVNFGAHAAWGQGVSGAVLYATTTTSSASGNQFFTITDNGASSAAAVLVTAGPSQILRGVRFGPNPIPAAIAVAPQPSITYSNGTAQFGVTATGTLLTYQWQLNGTNLSGATSSTLSLPGVTGANAGSYSVIVGNSLAAVTSAPVTLTVIARPTAPYPAAVLADNPQAFLRLDEPANAVVADDYLGGYNGLYTNSTTGQLPGYNNDVTDPNEPTALFSGIDDSYVGNIPLDFATNSKAEFSIEAWIQGSAQSDGSGIIGKGYYGAEEFYLDCASNTSALRFLIHTTSGASDIATSSFVPDGNWHHVVGVCDEINSNLALYVDGQVTAETNITGSGILPAVFATGYGTPYLTIGSRPSAAAFSSYNQQFDGAVSQVAVYRYALSSNQVLNHYLAAGIAPEFTVPPTNQVSVDANATVTINAAVVATLPVTIQWLSNGVAIPWGTNASLTLTNVPSSLNGVEFTLTTTNAYGFNNSPGTSLNVYSGAPQMISDVQPSSITQPVGYNAQFTASFGGSAPIVFHWQLNGQNLTDNGHVTGSQTPTLTISNCLLSDSGTYQLMAQNSSGSASTVSGGVLDVTEIQFNNGTGWTTTGGATFNGNNGVGLTDGGTSETRGVFLDEEVDLNAFAASWVYQQSSGTQGADGTAFVVQDNPEGANALGGGGGDLGYIGLADSVGLEFNIYTNNVSGIALGTNGVSQNSNGAGGPYAAPSPVSLVNGDPIGVSVLYVNGLMSVMLTDSVAQVSFSTNYSVNIPNVIGSATGYVGFTSASGAVGASQSVSDFVFSSMPFVSVQNAGGGMLNLTWPISAQGFILQKTSSLINPTWVTVSQAPLTQSGVNTVTVPQSGTTEYYRVVLP